MKSKRFKCSLFIFRRDLRLSDNTALIAALSESETVIPCFIFDTRQTTKHPYFSQKAFLFLLQSLDDLRTQLHQKNGTLYFFEGIAETVVDTLLTQHPTIDAVYFNRDYTPFSRKRDDAIKKVTETAGKYCFSFSDALLHDPDEIYKSDHSPYTIYTPFMRKSREFPVAQPRALCEAHFYRGPLFSHVENILSELLEKNNAPFIYKGGRTQGLRLLKKIGELNDYEHHRDFPAKNATSHLSAHHKFGTISVRESYQAMSKTNTPFVLTNELYWRDFFTHIAYHFPNVLGNPFHAVYQHIPWKIDLSEFKRWCDGNTGFPIVDAGMRELNETGLMHNRVRMIVGSFLVKDLHISWRWGERYFAQRLLDYDPAVNNGNWQWVASTGCDAQPYFRIFNPWLQQKRFDLDGAYIKHWVPELKNITPDLFHAPQKMQALKLSHYPQPMIDHSIEINITKNSYAEARNKNKS